MANKVLLIEDDDALRQSLAQTVELAGMTPLPMASYVQARRSIRANFAGVILSDIRMPHQDGFDVLRSAQTADKDLPVILLTGHSDVPTAMRAMKNGAWDYLEKPCSTDRLTEVLRRAQAHRALVLKSRAAERALLRNDPAATHFPGAGPASETLRTALRKVAATRSHVCLYGATGVGRRQAAYAINRLSPDDPVLMRIDANGPLTIPAGGFTSPDRPTDLVCRNMEKASAETVLAVQSLMTAAGLRLIFLSDRPATALPAAEAFDDPAAMNAVVDIHVPTLDQRREDLADIYEMLLRQAARNLDVDMPDIPASVATEIAARQWTGNLPELRAFATATLQGGGSHFDNRAARTLAEQVDAFEKLVITDALKRHNGRAAEAAKSLGLPRNTFYDRLTKHGLSSTDFRQAGDDSGGIN